MTKIIKINALVASILLLTGTFFKLSHWPGANIIIVIGGAAGILLFVLFITLFFGKLLGGFEKFNVIFASLAIIVTLLAFIFKVMHLQGGAQLIWIADIGILTTSLLLLIDGLLEKDTSKWSLKIIAGFFILLMMLALLLAG